MKLVIAVNIALFMVAVIGGNVIVKLGMKQFVDSKLPQGFPSAGKVIGIIERTIFWICLSINQISLIGFILRLKAIYRYGDIQGDNNQKMRLSEYFIIGTFLSLGWTLLNWIALEKMVKNYG